MQVRETTKKEIEERLTKMGDYVKMDYLSSCLKKPLDFETRRFALIRLSELYESRRMLIEAGKMMKSAADISSIFQNKINDFVKSAELFIKGTNYDEAEISMKKAISLATENQKREIKNKIKELYKNQASEFIKKDKKKNALILYERLIPMELDDKEKEEIRNKLLNLYENLGKVREYLTLKKSMLG